jgi:hypothetical protein
MDSSIEAADRVDSLGGHITCQKAYKNEIPVAEVKLFTDAGRLINSGALPLTLL